MYSRRVHANFSVGVPVGAFVDVVAEAERLDPGGCEWEFGGEVSQVEPAGEDEMIPCEEDVEGGVSHGLRYYEESCVHVLGDRATKPLGPISTAA